MTELDNVVKAQQEAIIRLRKQFELMQKKIVELEKKIDTKNHICHNPNTVSHHYSIQTNVVFHNDTFSNFHSYLSGDFGQSLFNFQSKLFQDVWKRPFFI